VRLFSINKRNYLILLANGYNQEKITQDSSDPLMKKYSNSFPAVMKINMTLFSWEYL